jgi:hypothetical protein
MARFSRGIAAGWERAIPPLIYALLAAKILGKGTALFAFYLALVAFNALSLLKASLRAAHGEELVQEQVSGYYLSLEIRGTYDGIMIAAPAEHWQVFRILSLSRFASLLKNLALRVQLRRFRKHPPPRKNLRHERAPTRMENTSQLNGSSNNGKPHVERATILGSHFLWVLFSFFCLSDLSSLHRCHKM